MDNIKNKTTRIALRLITVVTLVLTSCTEKQPTQEEVVNKNTEQPPKAKEGTSIIELILMKDYNDATELLSIKHKIPLNNSNTITSEYIKIYDPTTNEIITGINDERNLEEILNPDESLSEFIERMTLLTGESSDKISSYIIDLKMYMKIMEQD